MSKLPLTAMVALVLAACGAPPAATSTRVTIAAPSAPPAHSATPASSAAAPPPAWPPSVDLSLAAPNGFHLVATRDREALVVVSGEVESDSPMGRAHESTEYYARLDVRSGCMEETHAFPVFEHAEAEASLKSALAAFAGPAFAAEIAGARAISRAFGPGASPIPFGPDGSTGVLQIDGTLLSIQGDSPPRARVANVTSYPTMSSDGAFVLFASASSALAILDTATMRTRPIRGSAMRLAHAYASGDSFLAIETDDTSQRPAQRLCVMRVDPRAAREKQGVCVPANPLGEIASALSADGRFLALVVEHGAAPSHVVAFDTSSWQKVTDVVGHAVYPDVDARGRVGWYDGSQSRSFVAEGAAAKPVVAPSGANGIAAQLVGFSGGDVIVGYPPMEMGAFVPVRTLRDLSPCGHVRALHAP